MNKDEFAAEFKKIIDSDEEITISSVLEDLEDWDSLSAISVSAFMDKTFGKKVKVSDINKCSTVEDIYNLGAN